MDNSIEIIDPRGMPEELAEQAWTLFVQNNSMAETARAMGVPYERIRSTFRKDPLRMEDVRIAQQEASISRWRPQEALAATTCGRLLGMVNETLDHIEVCQREGRLTDLIDPKSDPNVAHVHMTPAHALQWLLAARVLDMAQKVGFTASKIVEGTSLLVDARLAKHETKDRRDPSQMTSAELIAAVKDFEAAGLKLPWGVSQWQASQPPAGGESSPPAR